MEMQSADTFQLWTTTHTRLGTSSPAQAEIHTYDQGGNDTFNLWHRTIDEFSHGVHLRSSSRRENGDFSSTESDKIKFRDLDKVHATVVGRLEDFTYGQDRLYIENTEIDIANLPANGVVGGNTVRLVEYVGAHNDAGALTQQWLLIETSGGGRIFYALEDARADMNLDGGASGNGIPNGDEYHFIPESALPDWSSLVDVAYDGHLDDDVDLGNGNDVYNAGDGSYFVLGGDGRDTLRGQAGEDTLHGEDGDDRISGGGNNDFLYGDAGQDRLWGNSGNDYLSGGDGNDRLYGQNGNDILFGNAGDDLLYGDRANDTLIGGDDADTFVFSTARGIGRDVIRDFSSAEGDQIDLRNVTQITDWADLRDHFREWGGDLVIRVASGNSIELQGFDMDDVMNSVISQSDFIL